jgi:hypothetical protein
MRKNKGLYHSYILTEHILTIISLNKLEYEIIMLTRGKTLCKFSSGFW